MSGAMPKAVELTPTMLRLQWADGATELAADRLRAACRCGGCRARAPTPGEAAVELVNAAPVGQYALQLIFSDGHDRGIYPWVWLREMSEATSATGLPVPA